jgi:anaerobic dimethyl sulfoxide reductase subunit B (iron-sulfur subunit)
MADGYAFSHDPRRCIKCYTCEIACKQWRGISSGTIRLRRVYEVTTGDFPKVTRTFHSVACQQCPDAPCIGACPPGAISKGETDEVVRVDRARCDGCRQCLDACPFGIPEFDGSGILYLCDLCSDRLAEGKQPICTDACPTSALRWNPRLGGS